MKVLIIEDEEAASVRLKKLILEIDPLTEILGITESIESSLVWFTSNSQPDLIFADIQLADGPSFEIFKKIKITAPVIFTTAFDNYALQAFRHNGIDYLLKPVKKSELEQSLSRYKALRQDLRPAINYDDLLSAISAKSKGFQKRLVVRIGQTIRTIEIEEVAYFYTEEKITFATIKNGKRLPLDATLDELEEILDPSEFFRINRQFIIHIKSIESMTSYSKSRIKITLKPSCTVETIVSTERSAEFKQWLLGKSEK